MTLSTGREAATVLPAPRAPGGPRSDFATLRWVAIGSLIESVLLAAFFLFPFSHLWGQMPPPPSTALGGSESDWTTALSVALIFGLPSLAPFVFLARLPWRAAYANSPASARKTSASRWLTLGAVAL